MKRHLPTLILILALLGACKPGQTNPTAQVIITPANARIAATIACTSTLTFAVKPADQPMVAAYIYSVAQAVRSLAGGTVPSPDQLTATISLFTKNASVGQWVNLSVAIQQIYSGLYSNLQGDPKLAAAYLEAIAAGCEDSAAPYVAHATPTPTP
jgi:hypothetical protein